MSHRIRPPGWNSRSNSSTQITTRKQKHSKNSACKRLPKKTREPIALIQEKAPGNTQRLPDSSRNVEEPEETTQITVSQYLQKLHRSSKIKPQRQDEIKNNPWKRDESREKWKNNFQLQETEKPPELSCRSSETFASQSDNKKANLKTSFKQSQSISKESAPTDIFTTKRQTRAFISLTTANSNLVEANKIDSSFTSSSPLNSGIYPKFVNTCHEKNVSSKISTEPGKISDSFSSESLNNSSKNTIEQTNTNNCFNPINESFTHSDKINSISATKCAPETSFSGPMFLKHHDDYLTENPDLFHQQIASQQHLDSFDSSLSVKESCVDISYARGGTPCGAHHGTTSEFVAEQLGALASVVELAHQCRSSNNGGDEDEVFNDSIREFDDPINTVSEFTDSKSIRNPLSDDGADTSEIAIKESHKSVEMMSADTQDIESASQVHNSCDNVDEIGLDRNVVDVNNNGKPQYSVQFVPGESDVVTPDNRDSFVVDESYHDECDAIFTSKTFTKLTDNENKISLCENEKSSNHTGECCSDDADISENLASVSESYGLNNEKNEERIRQKFTIVSDSFLDEAATSKGDTLQHNEENVSSDKKQCASLINDFCDEDKFKAVDDDVANAIELRGVAQGGDVLIQDEFEQAEKSDDDDISQNESITNVCFHHDEFGLTGHRKSMDGSLSPQCSSVTPSIDSLCDYESCSETSSQVNVDTFDKDSLDGELTSLDCGSVNSSSPTLAPSITELRILSRCQTFSNESIQNNRVERKMISTSTAFVDELARVRGLIHAALAQNDSVMSKNETSDEELKDEVLSQHSTNLKHFVVSDTLSTEDENEDHDVLIDAVDESCEAKKSRYMSFSSDVSDTAVFAGNSPDGSEFGQENQTKESLVLANAKNDILLSDNKSVTVQKSSRQYQQATLTEQQNENLIRKNASKNFKKEKVNLSFDVSDAAKNLDEPAQCITEEYSPSNLCQANKASDVPRLCLDEVSDNLSSKILMRNTQQISSPTPSNSYSSFSKALSTSSRSCEETQSLYSIQCTKEASLMSSIQSLSVDDAEVSATETQLKPRVNDETTTTTPDSNETLQHLSGNHCVSAQIPSSDSETISTLKTLTTASGEMNSMLSVDKNAFDTREVSVLRTSQASEISMKVPFLKDKVCSSTTAKVIETSTSADEYKGVKTLEENLSGISTSLILPTQSSDISCNELLKNLRINHHVNTSSDGTQQSSENDEQCVKLQTHTQCVTEYIVDDEKRSDEKYLDVSIALPRLRLFSAIVKPRLMSDWITSMLSISMKTTQITDSDVFHSCALKAKGNFPPTDFVAKKVMQTLQFQPPAKTLQKTKIDYPLQKKVKALIDFVELPYDCNESHCPTPFCIQENDLKPLHGQCSRERYTINANDRHKKTVDSSISYTHHTQLSNTTPQLKKLHCKNTFFPSTHESREAKKIITDLPEPLEREGFTHDYRNMVDLGFNALEDLEDNSSQQSNQTLPKRLDSENFQPSLGVRKHLCGDDVEKTCKGTSHGHLIIQKKMKLEDRKSSNVIKLENLNKPFTSADDVSNHVADEDDESAEVSVPTFSPSSHLVDETPIQTNSMTSSKPRSRAVVFKRLNKNFSHLLDSLESDQHHPNNRHEMANHRRRLARRCTSLKNTKNCGKRLKDLGEYTLHKNKHKQLLRLNIGGQYFELSFTILMRYPHSTLAKLAQQSCTHGEDSSVISIDRSPLYFPFIIDLFRTGHAHGRDLIDDKELHVEARYYGVEHDMFPSDTYLNKISATLEKKYSNFHQDFTAIFSVREQYELFPGKKLLLSTKSNEQLIIDTVSGSGRLLADIECDTFAKRYGAVLYDSSAHFGERQKERCSLHEMIFPENATITLYAELHSVPRNFFIEQRTGCHSSEKTDRELLNESQATRITEVAHTKCAEGNNLVIETRLLRRSNESKRCTDNIKSSAHVDNIQRQNVDGHKKPPLPDSNAFCSLNQKNSNQVY